MKNRLSEIISQFFVNNVYFFKKVNLETNNKYKFICIAAAMQHLWL